MGCLLGRSWIDDRSHARYSVGREPAIDGVRPYGSFVGCVHAIDLVVGHVALDPLTLGGPCYSRRCMTSAR